jgi:hypothetical protein
MNDERVLLVFLVGLKTVHDFLCMLCTSPTSDFRAVRAQWDVLCVCACVWVSNHVSFSHIVWATGKRERRARV